MVLALGRRRSVACTFRNAQGGIPGGVSAVEVSPFIYKKFNCVWIAVLRSLHGCWGVEEQKTRLRNARNFEIATSRSIFQNNFVL
jgi:hypothetical protein